MRPEDPLREDLALETGARRLEAAERALGRGEATEAPLSHLSWLDEEAKPASGLVLPPMITSDGGLWIPDAEAPPTEDPLEVALAAWREHLATAQRLWPHLVSMARRRHAGDALAHRRSWLTADTPPQRRVHATAFVEAVEASSAAALEVFSELDPMLPLASAPDLAARLLEATDDAARDILPSSEYVDVIPMALARDADASWPRVRDGWAEGLFAGTGLLDGLTLPHRQLSPEVWGASTFARDLGELGVAVFRAGRPRRVPFVLHQPPDGQREAQRRNLFSDLVRSEPWLKRHLSVGRDRARGLRRALSRAALVEARMRASTVLCQAALREGVGAARERHADLGMRIADGWPSVLLATVPRLRADADARLLGTLASHRQAAALVDRFDEDWFLNPRAAEALRADDARVVDATAIEGVDDWVASLETALS